MAIDTKLHKALKQLLVQKGPALDATLSTKANELTSDLGDASFIPAVRQAITFAGKARFEKQSPLLAEALAHLKQVGLTKSGEYLALSQAEKVCAFDTHDIVRCAPSCKTLDELAKKSKNLRHDLERIVTESSDFPNDPVLVEWFVSKVPVARLSSIASLLNRFAQKERVNSVDLRILATALARDKSGVILSELLAATADQKAAFSILLSAIGSDFKTLTSALAAFPKVASGQAGSLLHAMTAKMAPLIAAAPQKKHFALSRTVMAVTAGLLSIAPRKPAARLTAAAMCSWSIELENSGSDLKDLILPRLAAPNAVENTQPERLSPKAAATLGDTVDKLHKGFDASALINALVVNLGLEFLDEKGDVLEYDFRSHQDTVGGLVTGDLAEVIRPGLRSGPHVVLKSAVRPAQV